MKDLLEILKGVHPGLFLSKEQLIKLDFIDWLKPTR